MDKKQTHPSKEKQTQKKTKTWKRAAFDFHGMKTEHPYRTAF